MFTFSAAEFSNFIQQGLVEGGDIVFCVHPHGTGGPNRLLIKGMQKTFGVGDSSDWHAPGDPIPHEVVHSGIAVKRQNPATGHMETCLAESRPPHTKIGHLNAYVREKGKEQASYVLFRPEPGLGSAINSIAINYAEREISYPKQYKTICTLHPKPGEQRPGYLPDTITCASFVAKVVNDAASRLGMPQQIPFNDIAPDLLNVTFKGLERNAPRYWGGGYSRSTKWIHNVKL